MNIIEWVISRLRTFRNFERSISSRRSVRKSASAAPEVLEQRTLLSGTGLLVDSEQVFTVKSETFELGDIDGDGDLDAVVAYSSKAGQIWLNDGAGGFTQSSETFPRSSGVRLGDLDGDDDLDLYIIREYVNATTDPVDTIWLNDGTGEFTKTSETISYPGRIHLDVILADINNDNALDAVITYGAASANSSVYVQLNDGGGGFTASEQVLGDEEFVYYEVAAGDVNGDENVDLFITQIKRNRISQHGVDRVWLNDGTGQFSIAQIDPAGDTDTSDVALGDVDGDGDLDAVLTTRTDDVVLLNNGLGMFSIDSTIPGEGVGSDSLQFGDLDNDGDLDFMTTKIGPRTEFAPIKTWFNQGDGTFEDSGNDVVIETPSAYRFELGDLDGDGDLDVFMAAGLTELKPHILFNPDAPLDFDQNFENGNANGLNFITGSIFSIDDIGDSTKLKSEIGGLNVALIDRDYPIPYQYEISVEVTSLTEAGAENNAMIVFDYKSELDFKYARMIPNQNKWVFGTYDGTFNKLKGQVDWDDIGLTIDDDTPYLMHLVVRRSMATLFVNGQSVLETDFGRSLSLGEVGFGSYNAVTTFDNFQFGRMVDTGVAPYLPYTEDFEDEQAENFDFNNNSLWSVVSAGATQVLQLDASGSQGIGVAKITLDRALPSDYQISADVTSIKGLNRWHDGFLIFDYQSPTDFKYAGMFTGQNQWVIGQYQGNFNNRLAQIDWDVTGRKIDPNTLYNLRVHISGDNVNMLVGGQEVLSASFAAAGGINGGDLGVAGINGVTQFDNFKMAEMIQTGNPVSVPYVEDFNNGRADDFYFNDPPAFDPSINMGQNVLKGVKLNFSGLGLAYVVPEPPLPAQFDVSSSFQTRYGSQRWLNGFIIFDYKNPNDFKYAGMFTGQNEWIIGHYQRSFSNRLAEIDWDDTGRNIEIDTYYNVKVSIDGGEATLSVDGEEIVSADFGTPLNNGPVGVAFKNGETWFNDFAINLPPTPALSDIVFADSNNNLLF